MTLAPGPRHDITQVSSSLLDGLACQCVIANSGYDSNAFIAEMVSKSIKVVIPPKKNRLVQRDYDKDFYKTRNLIERFIGYLK